jgi:CheY-like chemotaxis protein
MKPVAKYGRPRRLREKQSRRTVLVVEDDLFVRDSTCAVLESAGYRVLQAATAAEATKIFHGDLTVDVLLCDVVLPDESGIALTDFLERESPGMQTIVVSGYPRSVLEQQFKVSPTREILTKPYSAAVLVSSVEALLRAA